MEEKIEMTRRYIEEIQSVMDLFEVKGVMNARVIAYVDDRCKLIKELLSEVDTDGKDRGTTK